MPKIKNEELDFTSSISLPEESNVVYIPGGAGEKTKPMLFTSLRKFDSYIKEGVLLEDLSVTLAKRLLALGMQVLYQGFTVTPSGEDIYIKKNQQVKILEEGEVGEEVKYFVLNGTRYVIGDNEVDSQIWNEQHQTWELDDNFEVVNGVFELYPITIDGEQVTPVCEIDFVHEFVKCNVIKLDTADVLNIADVDWEELEDRTLYDVRFLTTGGYACPTSKMVECAVHRGDCVALLDHEKDLAKEEDSNVVATVRAFFEGIADGVDVISTTEKKSSPLSFGAAFTPWFHANLSGEEVDIPASFGYLFAYARMVQFNASWFAAAGADRGQIPELVKPLYVYTGAEVEMLQSRGKELAVELDDVEDNDGIAINPIALVNPYGYVVFGNRTLLDNSENDGILKATSFLNIRNLVSVLNKRIYQAARRYTFELNTEALWINFKSMITPLLDKMQSSSGVMGYRIERVPTDKKARLCARVRIIPIEAVEDFEAFIYLEDSILEVVE